MTSCCTDRSSCDTSTKTNKTWFHTKPNFLTWKRETKVFLVLGILVLAYGAFSWDHLRKTFPVYAAFTQKTDSFGWQILIETITAGFSVIVILFAVIVLETKRDESTIKSFKAYFKSFSCNSNNEILRLVDQDANINNYSNDVHHQLQADQTSARNDDLALPHDDKDVRTTQLIFDSYRSVSPSPYINKENTTPPKALENNANNNVTIGGTAILEETTYSYKVDLDIVAKSLSTDSNRDVDIASCVAHINRDDKKQKSDSTTLLDSLSLESEPNTPNEKCSAETNDTKPEVITNGTNEVLCKDNKGTHTVALQELSQSKVHQMTSSTSLTEVYTMDAGIGTHETPCVLVRHNSTSTSGPFLKKLRRANRLHEEMEANAAQELHRNVSSWRKSLESYRCKLERLKKVLGKKDQMLGSTSSTVSEIKKEIKHAMLAVRSTKERLNTQCKLNAALMDVIESKNDNPTYGTRSTDNNSTYGTRSTDNNPTYGTRSTDNNPTYGTRSTDNNSTYGTRSNDNNPTYGTRSSDNNPSYGTRSTDNNPAYGTQSTDNNPTYGTRSTDNDQVYGGRSSVENSSCRVMDGFQQKVF